MPVLQQTPVISYTANGSVTSFSFPFQVLDLDDLNVYIDSAPTTNYSVDGIGEASGGVVNFELPPANGSVVRIARIVIPKRTTDYVEGGYVQAETLDADFDRLVMMVQYLDAVSLKENSGGALDIESRRLVNVSDPIGPQDAVTKIWTETSAASSVAQAITQANAAAASAIEAANSAIEAAASAQAAENSANGVSGFIKITSNDDTANNLDTKLVVTGSLTKTVLDSGNDEKLQLSFVESNNLKVSETDTTADKLNNKLVVSGSLTKTTLNAGANEQIQLSYTETVEVPVGIVSYFATSTAPAGYLKANGALVSRTTYAALFAVIGTTYGAGDGSTTFKLPDLRGEFIRGWDDARGVDTGRAIGSAQTDQNKSHTHTGSAASAGAHTHTIPKSGGGESSGASTWGYAENTYGAQPYTGSSGAHTHTLSINADGGTEARPRNVALLACIKY
ncbi:phage tail fiber protein [Azonexus hydrophilus]|uniref:phage tail fiber domain-containing protein n=1 Tax=Azonexus hydrophilus TaxID=418702 RepID=UPI0004113E1A|nr:phage tail fiber protein [Azonexus hydrophilus]